MASQKQESSVQDPISSGKSKAKSITMTFHIDPELKREATEIVKDYGLNLTAVTRAFYKQIVRDGSIPLNFRYDSKSANEPDKVLDE